MIWFFVSFFGWLGVAFARRNYWGMFLFILVLASAFRYYVGSDFDDYVVLFEHAASGREVPVEFSYSLLARGLSALGFNFQAQIVLYSILTYLFLYWGLTAISRDKEFLGVVIFFVYIVFYFPSLSIMRQALAAAIAFYGCYRYLHKNRFIEFFLTVAFATFVHMSSIVYLLCIPFYFLKPPKTIYFIILAIAAVLGFTIFGDLLRFMSDALGFSYKGYVFESLPIRAPVFYVFTIILIGVFIYSLSVVREEHYFLLNVIFFIVVARLLAVDYKPLNRVGASFSIFIPLFLYQVFFVRFKEGSKMIAFLLTFPLLIAGDTFRAKKDYAYYQYSVNFCVYGSPCPVSVVGDLPLEQLLIREELR